MNLKLPGEIISELNRLERILTGKIPLSHEDMKIMVYNYARDSDYFADVFMLNVRLLFSKTKGHEETTSIVFQALIEIAVRAGRSDLNQRIADCQSFVANSSLPQDNLWRSYDLPTIKPKSKQPKTSISIIRKCGTVVSKLYSVLIHPSFIGYIGILAAILIAFVTYYIVEHDKVVTFFNKQFPWMHLK